MTTPDPKPPEPEEDKDARPVGFFRNAMAWVLAFMGVNPGYKPWEEKPQPPKGKETK